jgi:hypothetical protein
LPGVKLIRSSGIKERATKAVGNNAINSRHESSLRRFQPNNVSKRFSIQAERKQAQGKQQW